jgi:hypothetical protein
LKQPKFEIETKQLINIDGALTSYTQLVQSELHFNGGNGWGADCEVGVLLAFCAAFFEDDPPPAPELPAPVPLELATVGAGTGEDDLPASVPLI